MQQIKSGILYEDSYLGVTLGAIVLHQGVVIVDAPLRADDARSWRSTLINQHGGPNRLLVSLDSHPDRTLGARAMECTMVAHQETALAFQNRPTIFKGQTLESGAVWETYSDAIGMRWTYPDITFSKQMSLHWGTVEVILKHQPGPTPGSLWVVIPDERVIFVGDTVLINQPPFLAQARLDDWLESLDMLLKPYRDYIIVSGRGGPVGMEDIRSLKKLLQRISKRMEKLAGRGAPPEAMNDMVASLMSGFKSRTGLRDLYAHRLMYGLYQCYARRYPENVKKQSELSSEDL